MCSIHIFITSYLPHFSVFDTPSSGRPFHYLLKNYMPSAMLLPNVQYTLFSIYSAVPMIKTMRISSFCILNILKMSVKTLNCSTLISVGSCSSLLTPLLMPRLWNSRAIPLPTLWATPACKGITLLSFACYLLCMLAHHDRGTT